MELVVKEAVVVAVAVACYNLVASSPRLHTRTHIPVQQRVVVASLQMVAEVAPCHTDPSYSVPLYCNLEQRSKRVAKAAVQWSTCCTPSCVVAGRQEGEGALVQVAGAAEWRRWGGEVTAVLEGPRAAVVAVVGGRPFSGTPRRIVGATVGTAVAIGPTVANSVVAFASTGQETLQLLDKQQLQVLSEQAQQPAL